MIEQKPNKLGIVQDLGVSQATDKARWINTRRGRKIAGAVIAGGVALAAVGGAAACAKGETTTTEPSLPSTTTTSQEVATTITESTTTTTEKALPDIWTTITPESGIEPEIVQRLEKLTYGDPIGVNYFATKDPVNPENKIGFYVIRTIDLDGQVVRFIARDTDLTPMEVLVKLSHSMDEQYKTLAYVTGLVDYEATDRVLCFELGGDFTRQGLEDQDAYMSRTNSLLHSYFDDDHVAPGLTPKAKKLLEEAPKLNIYEYKDEKGGRDAVITYDKSLGQGGAIEKIINNL